MCADALISRAPGQAELPSSPEARPLCLFGEAAEQTVQLLNLQFAVTSLPAHLQKLTHVTASALSSTQLLEQVALITETLCEGFVGRVDRLLGEPYGLDRKRCNPLR